jgi:hypothetical protein
VRARLKSASEIIILGTALIVAGGVLLGVPHLHDLGWVLLGAGIILLAVALLSLVIAGLRPVVQLLRVVVRPVTFVVQAARHWNPLVWRGSPIGWRGLPGSRDGWSEVIADTNGGSQWRQAYESGVTCACYFTADASADVTERVRALVDAGGRLSFQITNGVFKDEIPPDGDPHYGVPKELCIDYVINGESRSVTYKENETIDLQVGR